jgi:hypothetical protein
MGLGQARQTEGLSAKQVKPGGAVLGSAPLSAQDGLASWGLGGISAPCEGRSARGDKTALSRGGFLVSAS